MQTASMTRMCTSARPLLHRKEPAGLFSVLSVQHACKGSRVYIEAPPHRFHTKLAQLAARSVTSAVPCLFLAFTVALFLFRWLQATGVVRWASEIPRCRP